MQKALVILGAGGLAREARLYAEAAGWQVIAFYADGGSGEVDGIPVLAEFQPEHFFLAAVGSPKLRRDLVRRAEAAGMLACPPIVDPRAAVLSEKVTAGRGTLIAPGCLLTTNIKIGEHCIINLACTIGHDVAIDDFVTLAPGVHVSGNVSIDFAAQVGTGATIREKVGIGVESVLGMGAVLTKSMPDGETWIGVPACKRNGL